MKDYFYGLCSTVSGLITGALIARYVDINRQKKHLRVDNGKPLNNNCYCNKCFNKKGGCNKCLKSQ